MKKINLTKHSGLSLAEIFQSLDIKFAFVNKNYEEVSAPAKCRDFLGDCIYSRKTKQAVGIWGFKYNYKDTPYDDCRFSLKFPTTESKENFIKNLPYLHEKEKQAKVKLSKVFETQLDNTLVIEGSNWWVSTIWKVSLYTFYLKVMSYKTPAEVKNPEKDYIKYLTADKENKMLSKVKTKVEYLPTRTQAVHDYMGFVSLIKGSACTETTMNHKFVFGV